MRSWCTALLYALAIAGYPLVSSIPPLLHVSSRLVSVPYRGAFLLLAFAVIAFNARRRNNYLGAFWLPLGIFWILYTVRIATDTLFHPIPLYFQPYEYYLYAYGICLLPALAFFSAPDEATLRRAALATLGVTSVACIAAMYVNYTELMNGTMISSVVYGRLASETLDPISLGHLGVSVTVMAMVFFAWWRGIAARALLVVLALIGMITAALAASRGPIVAFAAVLLFQFGIWVRGQSARRIAGVLTVAAVAIALLVQGAFMIEEQLGFQTVSRFEVLQDARGEQSSREHLDFAADAWQGFLDNPVTGIALEEPHAGIYPHNVAIESFMATGVLGGIAFCAFILGALWSSVKIANVPAARWVALIFIQQLVHAMLAGALYLSGAMWCLAAGLIALERYHRKPHLVASPGIPVAVTSPEPA